MPELPEVETTLRGIAPHLLKDTVEQVIIRHRQLRWPVPPDLPARIEGQVLLDLRRRGKYLLFSFAEGQLIMHLGMSGSLRLVTTDTPVAKHDHLDLRFASGKILRFTDPRRFGAALWAPSAEQHALLRDLGPEPLSEDFSGDYLYRKSRGRRLSIKAFVMDSKVVVGVGNIYANEALFLAGIRPGKAAGRLSRKDSERLVAQIKVVLERAIVAGGTTLRDFIGGDGKPGYFKQELLVYGRGGEPCVTCSTPLKLIRQGQRATVYCPKCQS